MLAQRSRLFTILIGQGNRVIVLARFTGADDTLLTNYTPDISPGSVKFSDLATITGVPGAFKITSNQATIPVSGAAAKAGGIVIETGVANAVVSGLVTTSATASVGSSGLIVRYINATNFWRIDFVNIDNLLRITEYNAATPTIRASAAMTVATTTQYPLQVTLSGNVITALSGAVSVSYTSTFANTATKHGICAYSYGSQETTKIDDFQVVA
jgi:hypothetical protein